MSGAMSGSESERRDEGRPERSRPDHGVRYVLDRQRTRGERTLRYRGRIEGPTASYPLEVELDTAASTPDGLSAVAQVPEAPDSTRAGFEKMAAAMVRAVVRRARKEGLAPPRRIQRWRDR